MRHETEERCLDLAGKIGEVLEEGLPISKEMLRVIESTCSMSDPHSLRETLNDESNEEVETLLSLIFFPDAAFQSRLENFLEDQFFQMSDEPRVARRLAEVAPEVPLRFFDSRESFPVAMPEWTAEKFVSRLNISKRLDNRLRSVIDRQFPESLGCRIKVRLRNSRFSETEERVRFLCTFFEKEIDDLERCLDYLLDLFEEKAYERDIYERLIETKKRCFQNLQSANRYRRMLEKDNVETLMLRGVRILCIDEAEARNRMKAIDRICLSVFGKTEYFQRPEEILESGGFRY